MKNSLGFSLVGLAIAFLAGTACSRPIDPWSLDGIIGHWELEAVSGQDIADSSASAATLHLGSSSGIDPTDPVWAAGGVEGSGCLSFSASSQQYAYGPATFSFPDNQCSVELWYKSTSKSGVLFYAGFLNCDIEWEGSGRLMFQVGDGSTTRMALVNDGAVNNRLVDGGWHLIACTFDGSKLTIYVDGAEAAYWEQAVTMGSATGVYLGGRPSNTYVDGQIDEVRLFNLARSAEQESAYYEAAR